MKFLKTAVAAGLLLALFNACSKDEAAAPAPAGPAAPVVTETWLGKVADPVYSMALASMGYVKSEYTYQLKDNGTYEVSLWLVAMFGAKPGAKYEEGTWARSGDTLVFTPVKDYYNNATTHAMTESDTLRGVHKAVSATADSVTIDPFINIDKKPLRPLGAVGFKKQ